MRYKYKNPHIDEFGTKRWKNEAAELHRDENDLPAVEYSNGNKFWFINDICHRENGLPAIEYPNGYKAWYLNNVCYRRDRWIDKL